MKSRKQNTKKIKRTKKTTNWFTKRSRKYKKKRRQSKPFWQPSGYTKNLNIRYGDRPGRCYWGPSGPKCRVYKYRLGNKICTKNKCKPIKKNNKKTKKRNMK
jgi:hypothetical protein